MRKSLASSFAVLGVSASLFAAGCGDDETTESNSSGNEAAMSSSPDSSMSGGDKEAVEVGGELMYPDKNVVENASNAPNLTTLVSAVTAADLAETLSGEGPFTVFAPDNDAFAKIPKADLDELLKPENKEKLAGILTYHVVPGTLAADDLKDGDELTTVNGEKLMVSVEGDSVKVGDATVTQADVFQSNGVAHVIDTVLMPKG